MIDVNDKVRLTGFVKETGTGTFTISVEEFFVDGEWFKFTEPRDIEVKSEEYTEELTSLELKYIKDKAVKDACSTTLCTDDLEVVKSIAKKLTGNA